MSFRRLLRRINDRLRQNVEAKILDVCDLSSTNKAFGCHGWVREGIPGDTCDTKHLAIAVRVSESMLTITWRNGAANQDIVMLGEVELRQLKHMKWFPADPLHPLEALANQGL